jgi:tetratricopeptide (TPR) repeat protein
MLKSIFTTAIIIFSVSLMAQSIDEIKGFAGKNQWDKAKEGIDKFLANEKNVKKGEGWFWKAQIYSNIAKDPAFAQQSADARNEAFNAYKKYLELDPKAIEGTFNQHSPLFNIVFGYLEKATNSFNSKQYDDALAAFKSAEPVQDFIVKKGFSYGNFAFPEYDTQLYLNIAASAINAKKEDVAVEYYRKIADKKIQDKGFDEIYRYLVSYYETKGDKANLAKYLAIGKEVYPKDEYWCEVMLKEAGDDDKKKIFAKYDELLAGGCDTYFTRYNYGVEMFNYAYVSETVPDDRAAIQAKIEEVLKKAIPMNPPAIEANMLMCRHFYATLKYLGIAYDDIKGTKPEDVKKRNDLNVQINKAYEDAFPYVTTLFNFYNGKTGLKAGEKGQFKIITNMLLEYWENKKDKAKIKEYSDRLKEIE